MKKSFILYTNYEEKMSLLTTEEIGVVMVAVFQYVKNHTIPDLEKHLMMVFNFIKIDLDENDEKYKETSKKNSENARKRWDKLKPKETVAYDSMPTHTTVTTNADNDNDNDNDMNINNKKINKKEKKKNFIKPTLEELKKYIQKNNLKIEPNEFLDFYNANGWMVGKNPMKDWQATIRNWHRRRLKEIEVTSTISDNNKKIPDWYGKEISIDAASAEEMKQLEETLQKL